MSEELSAIPPPRRRRLPPLRLIAASLAVGLVAFELLYLGAAHYLLRTEAGHRLFNRRPERFAIAWDDARSLLPGRVELDGVTIRGRSRRQRYEIRVDHATARFSLLALAGRSFHTRRLSASGVEVRLEPLPAADPNREATANESSSRSATPGSPPAPPRKARRGWRIHLGGLDLRDVRELPAGRSYRLSGSGTAEGDLDFVVRGETSSPGLTVRFDGARLRAGDQALAGPLSLLLEGRLDPFVAREHKGRAALRFFTGRLEGSGPITGFGFLRPFLARADDLALGGSGELEIDLHLRRGRVVAPSRLTASSPELSMSWRGLAARGTALIDGAVTGEDPGTTILEVELTRVGIHERGAADNVLETDTLRATARASDLDLAAAAPELEIAAELPHASLPSLEDLDSFLPPEAGLHLADRPGELTARAELDTANQRAAVDLTFAGEQIAATLQGMTLAGDLRCELRLERRPEGLHLPRLATTLKGGSVSDAGTIVAQRVDLELELTADRPLAELRQREGLRELSGSIRLSGDVDRLGFLEPFVARAPWLSLAGEGRLDGDLVIERGVVAAGSRVDLKTPRLELRYLDYRAAGSGRLHAAAGPGGDLSIEAELARFTLARKGMSDALLAGSGFRLLATASSADLAGPPPDLTVDVTLPRSRIPALATYAGYFPERAGIALVGGSGEIEARLRLDTRGDTGSGSIRLSGSQARLRFENLELTGDFEIETRLGGADLARRRFRIDGTTVELDGWSWPERDRDRGPWSATATLASGWIRLAAPLELDVQVALLLSDAEPLIDLFAERKKAARFLGPLLSDRDVRGRGRLRLHHRALALDPVRLETGKLLADARLCVGRDQRDGVLLLRRGRLSAGAQLTGDRREWKLTEAPRWYAERSSSLGSSFCSSTPP